MRILQTPPAMVADFFCIAIVIWAFLAESRISIVLLSASPLAVLAAFASLYLVVLFCGEAPPRFPTLERCLVFIGQNTLIISSAHLFDMNLLLWTLIGNLLPSGAMGFFMLLRLKMILYSLVAVLVNALKDTWRRRLR